MRKISLSQVKYGAILSYILIILNTVSGLLVTPYIVDKLGGSAYGVYKTMSSFTAALLVLDIGLGGTLLRYISRYRADKEEEKIPNFISMSLFQAGIISVVVIIATGIIYFFIDNIYGKGLTAAEIVKAKQLYVFLCAGIIAHIFENVFNGVITGFNKFMFGNGLKIIRVLIRILTIYVALHFIKDALVIVLLDLFLTIGMLCVEIVYINRVLNVKIKFSRWEHSVFKESFKYSMLIFITTIATQANGNLDNVIIGAVVNAGAVTVYSMGLMIFSMFEQLSTSISSVMLPTVTETLKNDDENLSATQKLILKAGRIQFALLGGALTGFIVLGKTFVNLWLGNGYEDVYIIVLILMLPSLLELCVNVCLSILRAQNRLVFRTMILLLTTVLNIIISLVGTYFWNYYAAAVGTAFSYFVGSVIIMNIYYYKIYKINMIKMYKNIFGKIWICLILSGIACFAATLLFENLLAKMLLGVAAFAVVYLGTLWAFGLNKEEKAQLRKTR